ncbi:MAG: UvrD-helicase domain-containing protein, partial [Opitutaceae bacterium]
MDSEPKKRILDDFLSGRLQVVVATNAFGMGIDKEDIRLVIHADTPGSLENYLQEAGRAGRDRNPAECVLLYNDQDLERQFSLLAMFRIEKRDIDQIWRAIRKADRGDGKPVALTVSEILNDAGGVEPVSFVAEDENVRSTKVRTAIAVLEKQGFLERDENQNRVFQVRPLVRNEEEAIERMERLDLSEAKSALWLDVLRLLLSNDVEPVTSLEPFAELPRMQEVYRQLQARSAARVSPFSPVIQVLNEMARPEIGLLSKDVLFSAYLRAGRSRNAATRLRNLVRRENDLIEALRDSEPSPEGWVPLSIRQANEHLIAKGHDSQPNELIRALEILSADGRKIGRPAGLVEVAYRQNDSVRLRLSASWMEVMEMVRLRAGVAAALIELLLGKAKLKSDADETIVLVDFSEAESLSHLQSDLTLNLALVRDLPGYLQYVLVYLHDNDVIELKNGKALITQSMNLRILGVRKGREYRRFTRGDYAALSVYYAEKIFQIHVVGEYVRAGVERLGAHLRLVNAYFQMGKDAFAARFLRGNPEIYARATGIDSFRNIVDSLNNPVQQAIVAESASTNLLVLAGPGSGKTRVVAHRCAYLLRVERVRPERILVVCFNRHASLQLRRAIYRLVGADCFKVMIQTYHGLALRLTGRSLAGAADGEEVPNFDRILEDATTLLTGAARSDGVRGDETRDRILAGFSHILVDEYQDIDEREYAFVSAIAGRSEADEDRKLSIMAVGDDDQSIYGFKGANVDFIRRFERDYQAQQHYLTENYRSTKAIISVANRLIQRNTDRMKVAQPIRINRSRSGDEEGGAWAAKDPVIQGRVQRAQ